MLLNTATAEALREQTLSEDGSFEDVRSPESILDSALSI